MMFSIVTPTYNGSEYLNETIDSVISQSFEQWEWIIIDDGSDDDTLVIAHASSDSRIRVIEHEHIGNPAALRNVGARQCMGRYLLFLDMDDLWHPNMLSDIGSALALNPESDVIFTDGNSLVHYDFGEKLESRKLYKPTMDGGILSIDFLINEMLTFNFIYLSGAAIKKEAFEDVLGFNSSIEIWSACDFDLWMKLIERKSKFYFHDACRVTYRIRGNSMSSVKTRLHKNKIFALQLLIERSAEFYSGFHDQLNLLICKTKFELAKGLYLLGSAESKITLKELYPYRNKLSHYVYWQLAVSFVPSRYIKLWFKIRNKFL